MGKSSKSSPSSFVSKIMQLDLFGETTGFTIEGSKQYPSIFGTVLSLMIFTLVIIYGQNKVTVFYKKGDNSFQEIVNRNELDPTRVYSNDDINLNPSLFILEPFGANVLSEDDILGYFTLSATVGTWDQESGYSTIETPMTACPHGYLEQVEGNNKLQLEHLIEERSLFCIEDPSFL